MVELRLVRAAATDLHSAAFAGGHRSAIGQCRGGVAAVPADVEGAGLCAVLEPTRKQCLLDIPGVESIPVDGPAGRRVGHPGDQARAVVPAGESPPVTYGVPDTELTSVKSVAIANMTIGR